MKKILSVAIVCMALLAATAMAGDSPTKKAGAGCGACPSHVKAAAGCGSTAMSAGKDCANCADCPMPADCDMCDGTPCEWDMSKWKGVKYSADGTPRNDLSAKQAEKVALQYLRKCGDGKGRVVSVEETPHCFAVSIQPKSSDEVQKVVVVKHTAKVRKLDA